MRCIASALFVLAFGKNRLVYGHACVMRNLDCMQRHDRSWVCLTW